LYTLLHSQATEHRPRKATGITGPSTGYQLPGVILFKLFTRSNRLKPMRGSE